MFKHAIPVVRVKSSSRAEEFYCGLLGFELRFAYRPDQSSLDPCYMGLVRDTAAVHVSSFAGDGIAGAAVYLLVDDVDAIARELKDNGATVTLEQTDQTWGNREMYVEDPDGNSVRFVQERG